MQTYLYEFPKSHFRYSTQYLSVHDEVFTSSWILYGLVFLTNKGCFPTTPASKEFEQFYWRVFWVFHCNCSCSKPCSTTSVVGTGNIFSYFLLLWHFPELNSDWFFFFLFLYVSSLISLVLISVRTFSMDIKQCRSIAAEREKIPNKTSKLVSFIHRTSFAGVCILPTARWLICYVGTTKKILTACISCPCPA